MMGKQCICGAVLLPHIGGGRQKQYCSERCKQRAKRVRAMDTASVTRDTFQGMINTVTTGDARVLCKSIPDNSIDLIFTDPPYIQKHMDEEIYAWLAQEAKRVLKPGGFLLAYCGIYWKYEAMQQLGKHLDYFWDFIVLNTQGKPTLWKRRIMVGYKSILAFSNGDIAARKGRMTMDVTRGSGKDKRYHAWGQDEGSAMYYLEQFTQPGDTVWEPFAGGGTTLVVAKQLKRNFIGFEIDPHTADIARMRLETFQPLLIAPGSTQMCFEQEVVA